MLNEFLDKEENADEPTKQLNARKLDTLCDQIVRNGLNMSIIDKINLQVKENEHRCKNSMPHLGYFNYSCRLARCKTLILLSMLFRMNKNARVRTVQFLAEREKLTRVTFYRKLRHTANKYFRVPPSLSQERLPLSFKFYNCILPLLKIWGKHCLMQFIQDCRKFSYLMKIDKLDNLVELHN